MPGRAKSAKPAGGDQRSDDQRPFCPEPLDQSAGPAREQEHQQNERQERRAGLRGRVALHLDQVQRERRKDAAQRGVEKQRQQICPTEIARPE